MKPPGLAFGLDGNTLALRVIRSDRATDAIWSAVEQSIDANMTPARFNSEVSQAWDYYRDEQRKRELQELQP